MSDINSSMPVKTEADIDERLQSKIVDYTVPTQGMTVDADGDAHVKAKLRDDAGNAFGTAANPIFVSQTDESPGNEIIDRQTTASVVKDASTTHDYTVNALKTLLVQSAIISASGEFKVEVQKETALASGVFNTVYDAFAQAARPFVQIEIHKILKQVAGAKIRIKITNKDNTQDVYSTLQGIEV